MNSPLRIAILDLYNGHPNEGMRCIKMLVEEFRQHEAPEAVTALFEVRQQKQVPDLADFDVFISSGGPGDPLDTGDWGGAYFGLVDALLAHNRRSEQKKFLFLICHSFQMVAHHLNLGEVTRRRSTSFGILPMHKTESGERERYFEALPEPFYAVDSRDYQLVQPDEFRLNELGIEILCLEKERPHIALERAVMAIRFSPEVFGTQFHPEADAEGMLRYFEKPEKREQVIATYGEEKYQDMVDHLNDPDKIMLTESAIIPSFLRHAHEALRSFNFSRTGTE